MRAHTFLAGLTPHEAHHIESIATSLDMNRMVEYDNKTTLRMPRLKEILIVNQLEYGWHHQ